MSSRGGQSSSDSHQTCAACKHQRRKCKNCPLAPFFPLSNPEKFLNVRKLFGVSNVVKILKTTDPKHWPLVMANIQFEADVWSRDPIYGCLGIIRRLQAQVDESMYDLEYTIMMLNHCREIMWQQQLFPVQEQLQFPSKHRVTNMLASSTSTPMFHPGERELHHDSIAILEDFFNDSNIKREIQRSKPSTSQIEGTNARNGVEGVLIHASYPYSSSLVAKKNDVHRDAGLYSQCGAIKIKIQQRSKRIND